MRAAIALALLACACVPGQGPMMDPGRDCTQCHGNGNGPTWTAAGTVFNGISDPVDSGVRGVKVTLTDANGQEVAVQSNAAGNFYTRESLAFPLKNARIEKDGVVRDMADVPLGGCNDCHTFPAPQRARAPSGRVALVGGKYGNPLMNPGQPCIECHTANNGPAYKAAGTVYATRNAAATQGVAGVTVRLTGSTGTVTTLTSNAAGNFFTPGPLVFPVQAEIQQGTTILKMGPSITAEPTDCNRCHVVGGEARGRVSLSGGSTGSPLMNPGEDCISCHAKNGGPKFTSAGTVYAAAGQGDPGVTVQLGTVTMISNAAGNFYTTLPIAFPARVAISKGGVSRPMDPAVQSPASCNECHSPGSGRDPGSYVSLTGGGG